MGSRVLLIAVSLLLAGCTTGSNPATGQFSPAAPFAAQLPALPAPGSAHQADAAVFNGNSGNMFYAKSDNALVIDQQLKLDSAQGALSWAIYDFSYIRFDLADSTLLVTLEADSPGTLYLAFSNYAAQAWQFQQVAVETGNNGLQLPIPKDSPFVDIYPDLEVGVSYLALMTWDGMDVTLGEIDIAMGVVNAPPANLVASDGTNPQWIHLGWDHVDYAQGYLIDYKPSTAGDEGWVELYGIPGIPNNEAVHLYTGTSPDDPEYGVSYDYRVRTYFYDGDISDYSNVDSGYRAFPAPQNLSATYNVHIGKVELAWDAVSGAEGYKIYRKYYLDLDFAYLDAALEPGYLDESLPNSDIYEYRVLAHDAEHDGPFSEIAQGSSLDFSFHDWQTFHDFAPDIRMKQMSGKICAAYFNTRFDDIYFAQANTLYPNNITSWAHFSLNRGVNSGQLSLGLLDGNPAIAARYNASDYVSFIYADQPVPLTDPTWTPTRIDESGAAVGRPTWIATDGVPMVAFHTDPEGADTEGLYIYRATSATPLTQGDWLGYQLEEGYGAGDTASMILADGVPAIVSNAAGYTDFYYR
jgi:hypothetical protein